MKARIIAMVVLFVFSGVLTNVYGESHQRRSGVPARVLTSYDFIKDPDLVARNDDLVLIFLDAAKIPEMSIPYENSQTHTRTICWDQEGSSHMATLIDEYGDSVFTLGPGECVSPTLETGFYTLNLYHDGTSKPATFVLQPTFGEGGGAETGVSANYSQADLDQLKNTKQCPECNLIGADLHYWDLTEANLIGAILGWADLTQAVLSEAVLTWANLFRASLTGADLSNATWTDGSKCAPGSVGRCIPVRPY
ncbi:MAG: pentapeptide repeat-containing protein [Deltaproteobacteria bacterium]|nr:pentapeptide repeat-containing protein [Deltaproteobacteria bacterium]